MFVGMKNPQKNRYPLLTNRPQYGKITIIVLNAAKGNKTAAHLSESRWRVENGSARG